MLGHLEHLADHARGAHDRQTGLHPVGRPLVDGHRLVPCLVGVADDAGAHAFDIVFVLELEQLLQALRLLLVLVGLRQQLAQLGVALAQARQRALVGREVLEALTRRVDARVRGRADELQRRERARDGALHRVERAVFGLARIHGDERNRRDEECNEQNSA